MRKKARMDMMLAQRMLQGVYERLPLQSFSETIQMLSKIEFRIGNKNCAY